jgi:parvulin-like peptidyl-prolyl isomerase
MVVRRSTRLFAVSLLVSGIGLGGCQGQQVIPLGIKPDFPTLLSMTSTAPSEPLFRAQNQERPAASTQNMLELGPGAPGNPDARGARIRAVVNGEAILDEEVYASSFQTLMNAHSEVEKAGILNQKLNEIIDREVILQDAIAKLSKNGDRILKELQRIASRQFEQQWLHKLMRANKYTDEEKFKEFLRASGMPVEMMRRQWERNFMAMEIVRGRIEPQLNKVGHLQITEYYEKHANDFQVEDNLTWQDIFLASGPSRENARQLANVLVSRLRSGEDFVGLAKAHDNGDSSLRENVEGIGHRRGEIRPPEVEETLFKMKEGELALIEVQTGFRIVKVTKRQDAGRRPFDDKVQKEIRDKLRGEIFQQEMKRIVNDLKRRAIIEIASQIN